MKLLKSKRKLVTLVFFLALTGLFLGVFVGQRMHSTKKIDVSQFHGTYLEHARPVSPFHLTGIDEKIFDNQSLQGKWTVLFFGFTHCGYVCPTAMSELAKMYRILEKQGIKNLPQIVMITIDPERDTLEKLSQYVTAFHPAFYGARSEDDSFRALTREMGIAYVKVVDSNNSENYDIQHSGAFMLVNPQGELNAFFTTPHNADLLAKDYLMLVS